MTEHRITQRSAAKCAGVDVAIGPRGGVRVCAVCVARPPRRALRDGPHAEAHTRHTRHTRTAAAWPDRHQVARGHAIDRRDALLHGNLEPGRRPV
jgi:hypothetical protein